ncbi:hypothetical protein I305_06036 [Cryptococcus gattii E566]|uniref:Uncharacterized protein n=2 Tax=Cryptococcus gattii TaxID=37769 RepID=E6R0W9_CRYGW|nr:Hypothetical Protein CGB_B5220C [Cryptococcus gattii WM276]ADV20519.1 Hypothetical Protein CGB_B5220C [Cryptococcus gattii WM276]KIR77062.1 hypothetical protein I306_06000 [Cryptococcus gattii EJB2]KIY31564.1 hypothetical protein I305_06036 [Cryptococcus gattii E566]KJE02158.1 hypothetical protein I311_04214 [Cryptococcus gattii NT-10]
MAKGCPVTLPFLQRLAFLRYSTYRVDFPLSPKDEEFWKVAAKEIYELRDFTVNESSCI